MADRFTDLERRVKALENKLAAPLTAAPVFTAPVQKSSDFLWQLLGALIEKHGRRLDIDHAINQIRSHAHDEAILKIFARPSIVR